MYLLAFGVNLRFGGRDVSSQKTKIHKWFCFWRIHSFTFSNLRCMHCQRKHAGSCVWFYCRLYTEDNHGLCGLARTYGLQRTWSCYWVAGPTGLYCVVVWFSLIRDRIAISRAYFPHSLTQLLTPRALTHSLTHSLTPPRALTHVHNALKKTFSDASWESL